MKFLWNQRRIESKEASFASAPFSNNMALDLCNVEWACSWSLVMPAMFCKLRILPTKLFQLIMNGRNTKPTSQSRGQMANGLHQINFESLRVLIGSAVEEICSGSLVGVNNTDSKEAQRPKLLETGAVGRVQGYKKISREHYP